MLTIEIVPGAVIGPGFDIAIRLSATAPSARRSPLYAPAAGRFAPRREIGERVAAGDPLGSIGPQSLLAPIDGVLRGVSARGARVQIGDIVAEVDPDATRGDCFERDAQAVMIASAVAEAVRDERPRAAAAGPR
jgi:predicted deacylase